MNIGTLARLIPVSKVEERTIKFRVEVGDTGTCIGMVMWGEPPYLNHYTGYLWGRGDPYAPGNEPAKLATTSMYPEEVALDIASLWWERERETNEAADRVAATLA